MKTVLKYLAIATYEPHKESEILLRGNMLNKWPSLRQKTLIAVIILSITVKVNVVFQMTQYC
jgi:hypothetical protein